MRDIFRRAYGWLTDADGSWRLPAAIAVAGTLAAAVFSLALYPNVAEPLNNRITTDGYDLLALGLQHHGVLAYYPSTQPTILRGPVYPVFLAALFMLGERFLPFSAQLAQAVLQGLTCLLAYGIARMITDRKRAAAAGLLCAVHPLLIWYTGRFVVETMSIFLFTLIVYTTVHLARKPGILAAIAAGASIGIGVLCKSTYLPFIVVVPSLLLLARPRRVRTVQSLLVVAASLLVVMPWIVRNHALSGSWGVVQALTGFNFYVGDAFLERYTNSPLGYAAIIASTDFTRMSDGLPDSIARATGAQREAQQDAWLAAQSLRRYARDPLFLLKKVGANALMFWTLGSTPAVSILIMLIQLPLLFFFIRSSAAWIKSAGLAGAEIIPVWLIACCFLIHLPVYALARFSVVFIPTMIAYVFSIQPSSVAHSRIPGSLAEDDRQTSSGS